MAVLHESLACLRISGEKLDPHEITRLLGCEPTSSNEKGAIRGINRSGRESKHRVGGWTYEAKIAAPGDIDSQAREILGKLTPNIEVWRSLSSQYRIDLFCGLMMKETNEGLVISPDTLREMGIRGIELDLCLYCPLRGDMEREDR